MSSSPIVAALIQPDTVLDEVVAELGPDLVALSLLDALVVIPDPRAARGCATVLAVLLVSACAPRSGARSFAAIDAYAHDAGQAVLDLLEIGAVAPHESTFRRLPQQLDPVSGGRCAQHGVVRATRRPHDPAGHPDRERRRMWALDGKAVRGARDGKGGQAHLVSVLDQASG